MEKVLVSHESIERQINTNIKNPFDALNEYIWNSIDSGAKKIEIKVGITQGFYINELKIIDDGSGIDYDDLKKELFGKFNDSIRALEKGKNKSLPHGYRGFGRFSFIKFANRCIWNTIYKSKSDGKNYKYEIEITNDNLDGYEPTTPEETKEKAGTSVSFGFDSMERMAILSSRNERTPLEYITNKIALEFCWIIELLNIEININNKKLDYSFLIEKKEEIEKIVIDNEKFEFKFIKWKILLKNEYSKFYLLNSEDKEVFVDTTTLNNRGDDFHHSLYVKSSYFDNFEYMKTRFQDTYKKVIEAMGKYLREKRKPFLEIFSRNKLKEFEENNLFPKFSPFEEKTKKPIYREIVKEVIEFAPSLVSSKFSNEDQRKVLLQLINKLLDDEESRNDLYDILEVLVDEENKELLQELNERLKHYGLKNILGLIKTVENRIEAIQRLRKMVIDEKEYYSESDLQKEIEEHFWIFGEEYNLMLGAEEDDFTKLRGLYYEKVKKMKKEEYEELFVSKKQVDLFICGTVPEGKKNRNLIVEIKKPKEYLKKEHYIQIDDYKDIIMDMPEFNSPDKNYWEFILLYTDISKEYKTFFEGEIRDKITGLAKETNAFKILVVKWADLLDEVDFKMKFLKGKLIERKKLKKPIIKEAHFSEYEKVESSAKSVVVKNW